MTKALKALVLPVLIAAAWEYMSRQGAQYAYIFIPLGDVWHSFLVLTKGGLAIQVLASLLTAVKGLLIGGAAGFSLALLMSFSRLADRLLNPLFHSLRQVPVVALIPLIVLWFGNTQFSKILVVSISVFEVIALNTQEGLRSVDVGLVDVGRVLKLGRFAIFRYIRIPAAMPSICTGFQHAIAFAWLSTVAAELLFLVGPGLGSVMERGQMGARMDTVIVCLIFIAVLGLCIHQLSVVVSRRVLRWRATAYER